MHVYLTTSHPEYQPSAYTLEWLRESAARDVHGVHRVTDDPDAADMILFAESHPGSDPLVERPVWHPLRRRHPHKCFLYQDADICFPLMPGVYPSLEKRHARGGQAAGGPYLARIAVNAAVTAVRAQAERPERRYLMSFVGANNSAVRRAILALPPAEDAHIRDTSGSHAWTLSDAERAAYEASYADVCLESRFMLCPRGIGPSTYRLYEALEIGRCPVILSDDFVPPAHLPWDRISVTVPEARAGDLRAILADIDWREKERAARQAFEAYLTPEHAFHYLVEACAALGPQPRGLIAANLRRYVALTASGRAEYWLRGHLRRFRR